MILRQEKNEQLFIERLFLLLAAWQHGNKRFCTMFCRSGSSSPKTNKNVSREIGGEFQSIYEDDFPC